MLFRFREFPIYKEARAFRILIYKAAAGFPKTERFGLADQIRRAANSILLNVAEGTNRDSDRDFAHFLTIALGSLEEVAACLDIALDEKFITNNQFTNLMKHAENVGKQLYGFRRSMKR